MLLAAPAAFQAKLSYTMETPDQCSSARDSKSVQPRSSQHGADSALYHHLAAHSWWGFGLPVWTEKRENSVGCKMAMCWNDWQQGQDD
ncbi:hypothetical protein HGM15179_004394 [Zosterops borbonicus]|uniref:Uncharacterized protein n=1 Tax=Zosterops borbonicus TaxID=364589 RepID=A0A8K1GP79_9PASS|nr:hypothetical protein HGM15179_004394 [Zosterops borbonicus]